MKGGSNLHTSGGNLGPLMDKNKVSSQKPISDPYPKSDLATSWSPHCCAFATYSKVFLETDSPWESNRSSVYVETEINIMEIKKRSPAKINSNSASSGPNAPGENPTHQAD